MPESLDEIMAGRNGGAGPSDSPASPPTESTPHDSVSPPDPGSQVPPQEDEDEGEPQADERGNVPLAALQRDREKRGRRYTEALDKVHAEVKAQNDTWERRFGELMTVLSRGGLQQQPQPQVPQGPQFPDVWDDPRAWANGVIGEQTQGLNRDVSVLREAVSRMNAHSVFGKEAVDAAHGDLEKMVMSGQPGAREILTALMQSPDPWGNLVQWHQSQPPQIEARLRREFEAKLAQTPQPSPGRPGTGATPLQGATRAAGPMPSNIAGAPNGTTRGAAASGAYQSLAEIMGR